VLKFSPQNAKIRKLAEFKSLAKYLTDKRKIYSFDLASGHSCPFADKCLSKVVDGKVVDGPNTEFRCYSASQEALFPKTFAMRKYNFDSLKHLSQNEMVDLITKSLPKNAGIVRIHSAGDMFNRSYFQAWMEVAKQNPTILFYTYTKSLPYWIDNLENMPYNLVINASYGGRLDALIEPNKLKSAEVVYSIEEAKAKKLQIDSTDELAANPRRKKNFALLIHGVQPAGSAAAKAQYKLRDKGYSK